MRWRRLQLDWSYALGELLIVVVGVLTALAVNSWNTDRLSRLEEVEVVDRLISDLQEDIERLEGQSQAIARKEASLLRLEQAFQRAEGPADPRAFLRDVIEAGNYGWSQFEARRTTFRELLGSAKFRLIRDAELRELINEYYDFDASTQQRIDDRETSFPHLAYLIVPRANEGSTEGDRGGGELPPDLSAPELERIVGKVRQSGLETQLTGELNVARFIRNIGRRMENRARDLVETLQAYRAKIE